MSRDFAIYRGRYLLLASQHDNGTSTYCIRRMREGFSVGIVLAFHVTQQGWLIGDGRDKTTARRAQRLTGNWC
jgi:hypothetical protein